MADYIGKHIPNLLDSRPLIERSKNWDPDIASGH